MNNGNNGKPRQINRVATPIKVNQNTNNVQPQNQGQQVNNNNKGNNKAPQMPPIPPKKVRPKKEVKPKKVDTHDPTYAVFGTILLILFAALVAFLGLYVVPKYLDNRRGDREFNDKPTTQKTTTVNNNIATYTLTNNKYIDTEASYTVADIFNLSLVNNGTDFDIMINNKKITTSDYVLPQVGVVDDIIIFITKNVENRTTKLYAVSKDTEVLLDLYTLSEDENGMVIMNDATSIVFNSVTVVLVGSRVSNESLILDNNFGANIGYNICNVDIMNEQKITDEYTVNANYSFTYLGNHEFSKLEQISSETLSEYKVAKNLCNQEG